MVLGAAARQQPDHPRHRGQEDRDATDEAGLEDDPAGDVLTGLGQGSASGCGKPALL